MTMPITMTTRLSTELERSTPTRRHTEVEVEAEARGEADSTRLPRNDGPSPLALSIGSALLASLFIGLARNGDAGTVAGAAQPGEVQPARIQPTEEQPGAAVDGTEDSVTVVLARAVLLEESEMDFEGAIERYRAVVDDPRADSTQVATARVRMARCLRELGREAEAGRQLRAAAEGDGPWAERARAMLTDEPQREARERQRVESLLLQMAGPGSGAFKNITMIGEAAAPILIEALENDTYGFTRAEAILEALVTIGGPDAAAYVRRVVRSDDEFDKRALINACEPYALPPDSLVDEPFFELLRDENADIRRQALYAARYRLPARLLATMLEDESLAVRVEAIDAARSRDLAEDGDFMDRAASALIQAWKSDDPGERRAAASFVTKQDLLSTPAGRLLWLEAIVATEIPAGNTAGSWPLATVYTTRTVHVAGNEVQRSRPDPRGFRERVAPGAVLEAARQSSGGPDGPRKSALSTFLEKCLPLWTSEDLPIVFDIVESDFLSSDVLDWILARATDEHAARVAELLSHPDAAIRADAEFQSFPVLKPKQAKMLEWLRGREPSRELLVALEAFLDEHLEALFRGPDAPIRYSPPIEHALDLLIAHPSRDGLATIERFALDYDGSFQPQILDRLKGATRPDVVETVLAIVRAPEFVPLYVPSCLDIIAKHDPSLLPGVAEELYRAGKVDERRGILRWLAKPADRIELSETIVSRIVDRSTRTGQIAPWKELYTVAMRTPRKSWPDGIPERSAIDLCQNFSSLDKAAPGFREDIARWLLELADASAPETGALAVRLLDENDPKLVRLGASHVLQSSRNEAHRRVALSRLRSHLASGSADVRQSAAYAILTAGGDVARPWVRPLLDDPVSSVRLTVARVLYNGAPGKDEPLDPVLEFLRDPDPLVRRTAAEILGVHGNPAAVPALIDATLDAYSMVRRAAESALQAIREHQERVTTWQKWMQHSDLQTESAAEALLAQAAAGRPTEVRVAAIRSLGTLGVAETLPMLIEWMTDPDPDVASAARETVERMNARTDAPNPDAPNPDAPNPDAPSHAPAEAEARVPPTRGSR